MNRGKLEQLVLLEEIISGVPVIVVRKRINVSGLTDKYKRAMPLRDRREEWEGLWSRIDLAHWTLRASLDDIPHTYNPTGVRHPIHPSWGGYAVKWGILI